jgi:hypothetical protein
MRYRPLMLAIAALMLAPALSAQEAAVPEGPIERVKLSDPEMSCPQIYGEVNQMDRIIAKETGDRDTGAAVAANAGLTQQAVGTAAHAAAMSGSVGSAVGLAQIAPLAGLFGNVAAANAQNEAAKSQERTQQARARKEHLTSLFIGKGCKLSEMQAVAPAPTVAPAAPATAGSAPQYVPAATPN